MSYPKPRIPAYIVFISRKYKRIRRIPNPAHPDYLETLREFHTRRAKQCKGEQ